LPRLAITRVHFRKSTPHTVFRRAQIPQQHRVGLPTGDIHNFIVRYSATIRLTRKRSAQIMEAESGSTPHGPDSGYCSAFVPEFSNCATLQIFRDGDAHGLMNASLERACLETAIPHFVARKKIAPYSDFVCTTKNSTVQNDGRRTDAASGLF
jgi:hypothetical protein